MKAHYFRNVFSEIFLVPEEFIEDFDRLTHEHDNLAEDEDADETLDEFNKKYWQYKREGELGEIKLFIEE